jgi:hypothetical protein
LEPNQYSYARRPDFSQQELVELVRSQLQALLEPDNLPGAKALLVPVQPANIADAIGGLSEAMQAIAGVLGAYILRFPKAQILTLVPLGFFITTIRLPAYLFLGFWFVQQAFYGIASLQTRINIGMESGGIAYWAHAGGFVFGALLGPLMGLYKRH